jgi:hypothetical protein
VNIAVKWIYQIVRDNHGIPLEAGQKPALCLQGRKHMLCVAAGHPVRVLKRKAADFDAARSVIHKDGGYSIDRAVEQLTDIGKRNGITKGAAALLQRARDEQSRLTINEDEFDNEEDIVSTRTTEKVANEVAQTIDTNDNSGDTSEGVDTPTTTSEETATMATTKKGARKSGKAKTKAAAKPVKAKTKAAAKSNGGGKKRGGLIAKAVPYMREEIKKLGGAKALERGDLKALFERTAEKFGMSPITCSIQYNRQIRNG